MKSLIGKKLGMTSIYDDNGKATPVTVLELGPCVVVQRKNQDCDGYTAVQLGYCEQKKQRLNKAQLGHYKKAGVEAHRILREFKVSSEVDVSIGDTLDVSVFEGVSYVDVVATGKGRGFQGVVKRYDFGGGRASHGGGWLRRTGSIGMCEFPGRVFKGKKMPGHMGGNRVTTQNLKVIQVRLDENILLVKGSIPGPNGGFVTVKEALKKKSVVK